MRILSKVPHALWIAVACLVLAIGCGWMAALSTVNYDTKFVTQGEVRAALRSNLVEKDETGVRSVTTIFNPGASVVISGTVAVGSGAGLGDVGVVEVTAITNPSYVNTWTASPAIIAVPRIDSDGFEEIMIDTASLSLEEGTATSGAGPVRDGIGSVGAKVDGAVTAVDNMISVIDLRGDEEENTDADAAITEPSVPTTPTDTDWIEEKANTEFLSLLKTSLASVDGDFEEVEIHDDGLLVTTSETEWFSSRRIGWTITAFLLTLGMFAFANAARRVKT